MYTDETISPQPLSAQSEGYFIRTPERGILIKGTRLFNATVKIYSV